MTVLLPRDKRRSRFLFDWSARWTLERNALDAITGQVATFTRASIGTAIDGAGRVQPQAYAQPRYSCYNIDADGTQKPCLLLEDTRTNVVLWNRDLTNAAWTKTTMTAAKDQIGADGLVNSASSLLATAGNATALQAITLASSARYQSAYVKRLVGTGTVQMTTDNGATWTAITLTTAWTRVTIPTQTFANPTVGFRLVTNGDKIAVDFVQNENGTLPSSAIATTTVAVTRAADALSFAFGDVPKALTVYVKMIDLGSNALALGVVDVGGNGSSPRFVVGGAAAAYVAQHSATSTATDAVSVALGDTAELRGVLNADGSTLVGVSKNAAAETTGIDATTLTLESAWNTANLYFNRYNSSTIGFAAFSAVRIAAGVQTLAFMREG